MENTNKPIGITSKAMFDLMVAAHISCLGGISVENLDFNYQCRVNDLKDAINRYTMDNQPIPIEWITEYNEKLSFLGVKENDFKL